MRIGTRASALALAQAGAVSDALDTDTELVTITTSGDRGDTVEDKSRFVKEIEQALLDGEIDLAVHSAKDLPVALPDGLTIAATPQAQDARDALVGATSLDQLSAGARIGSSSLRRRSQLIANVPGATPVELRGNVDTRLKKLAEGKYDAIVLAAAGLLRLGREAEVGCMLPIDRFVPAAGQGVLAIECRAGDDDALAAVTSIEHAATNVRLRSERAAIAALGADCHSCVGVHARIEDSAIAISGYVGTPDGKDWLTDGITRGAGDPEAAGRELAERMLSAGAKDMLRP